MRNSSAVLIQQDAVKNHKYAAHPKAEIFVNFCGRKFQQ